MPKQTGAIAFRKPITHDNLDELFAHHRGIFGGWSMEGDGAGGGDAGAGGGGDGGQGGSGGSAGQGAGAGSGSGADLGFPKDTPVAEMTAEQRAAYWQDKARKHEGRVKNVLGDRTPEQIKADLDELAELKKAQLTPAEKQLTEATDKGRAEGVKSERRNTATTLFRGALEAGGLEGEDLEELVANFNVDGYITDAGVDTTKITNFAKRFSPGKGTQQDRRRDFGAGQRREGAPERGAAGKAMAEKRFGKTTSTT